MAEWCHLMNETCTLILLEISKQGRWWVMFCVVAMSFLVESLNDVMSCNKTFCRICRIYSVLHAYWDHAAIKS